MSQSEQESVRERERVKKKGNSSFEENSAKGGDSAG